MSELWSGVSEIFSALAAGDSWMLSEALKHWSAYPFAAIVTIVGAFAILALFKAFPVLDRNLEKWAMVITYLTIAGVIFVEVFRRFVFQVQAPWSTTFPPYLFLVMTWIGCAYNTRLRTHLSFMELRSNLPRFGQFLCVSLDAVLWLFFALIVIVTTTRQTANSAANFQILLGTDDIMQWWFYIFVPVSWLLLSARVIENFIDDYRRYRSGEPVVVQAVLGSG